MTSTATALVTRTSSAGKLIPLVLNNGSSSSSMPVTLLQQQPSVMFPQMPLGTPDLDLWSKVSVKALKEREAARPWQGTMAEIVLEWRTTDSDEEVVDKLIEEAKTWMKWDAGSNDQQIAKSNLMASIQVFKQFCQEHLDVTQIAGYKVKLGAMVGPSCTRCPSWHQDYVPVRWLQTLHGPGSVYIDPCLYYHQNANLKQVMDNFIEVNIKERLIDESGIQPQQSPVGPPIVLVGNAWAQWVKKNGTDGSTTDRRLGVLHRSPRVIPKKQKRVLFSLDVLGSIEDDDGHCHDEGCGCANKA